MNKPIPLKDKDGYPTESSLRAISNWDAVADPFGLVEFVQELWEYPDYFHFNAATGELELHTAGWSGNEDIMVYLEANQMFWMLYWQKSERGGHNWFTIKKVEG